MLNKKEFAAINKDLQKFDESREKLIQQCRLIIQLSKKVIYGLHRNEVKAAKQGLKDMQKQVKALPNTRYDTGLWSVALQEYVEAVMFYDFLINNKIPTRKELDIPTNEYLLGMCDFTGELVRKCVQLVLEGKYEKAKQLRQLVDDIYWQFLQFNLRNSELRKKSDSIKHNLRRIEEVIYDVETKLKKR